jgi:hypothetical protein
LQLAHESRQRAEQCFHGPGLLEAQLQIKPTAKDGAISGKHERPPRSGRGRSYGLNQLLEHDGCQRIPPIRSIDHYHGDVGLEFQSCHASASCRSRRRDDL